MNHRIRTLVVLISTLASLLAAACKVPTKDDQRARIYGADAPADTIVPNTYFVVFDDATTDAALEEAKSEMVALGATIQHEYTHAFRGFSAELSQAALDAVLRHPQVSYLELARIASLSGVRTCPDSWGLDRINQRSPMLDGVATDDGAGAGVTIYVLDSGVRTSHVAFSKPPGTPPRDIQGICTVIDDCCTKDANGDCIYNTEEKMWTDCGNHGTFSAAIAAGSLMGDQQPPTREVGIAYEASIFSVRVATCKPDELPKATSPDLVAGLEQILARVKDFPSPAVALITASLDEKSPPVAQAVDNLIKNDVAVIVSAGNDGKDACNYSPGGSYDGNEFDDSKFPPPHPLAYQPNPSLTVGALAPSAGIDQPWSLSNLGKCVDIWAPGQGVTSASNDGCDPNITCDKFTSDSGTSFAAAHVAGVVAGLWSKNPSASALTIMDKTVALATLTPNIGPVLFSPSVAVSPDPDAIPSGNGCVDGVKQPCYGDSCNFCPSKERCCEGLDKCGHGLLCYDGECTVCGGAKGDPCCDGQVCRDGFFTCNKEFNTCSCGREGEPCCGGDSGTCEDSHECISGVCGGCGLEGLPCCAGTCTGAALDCVENVCKHCGFPNESCCDETCFLAGTTCDPGSKTCTSCGLPGQACCGGDCIVSGAMCMAGTCEPCGTLGAVCCENTCFGDDLACISGQCETLCGGLNEPCCSGNTCDSGAYVCMNGACTSCGGPDEPCCSGNTCDSGAYVCTNDACVLCGGLDEPCCSGNTCDSGAYVCASGACTSCGGINEPCCLGDTCDSVDSVCTNGACTPCGGTNEPCCSGDSCDSGNSACRNGTCEPCGGPNEICCSGNTCNLGPCAYAPAGEPCVFDTRTLATHPQKGFVEAITAYGRYWEFDLSGYAFPQSGSPLTSHPWLGAGPPEPGPCYFAPQGQPCKLDTRTFVDDYAPVGFVESVTAYGKYWIWLADGSQVDGCTQCPGGGCNECSLVTLDATHPAVRFSVENGPCTFAPPGQPCVFDTRVQVKHPDFMDQITESITAYGRYWYHVEFSGPPYWQAWGDLISVPRYASANGPCTYAPAGQLCTFDTRTLVHHPQKGFIESITAYGRFWEFDQFGAPLPGNGADLRSVPRYVEYTQ